MVVNQNGSPNGPNSFEFRGNVLVAYLTGIGPVNPPVKEGDAAGFDTLSSATGTISATIGNVSARVLFLGLTPGLVGLSQANLQIPADK